MSSCVFGTQMMGISDQQEPTTRIRELFAFYASNMSFYVSADRETPSSKSMPTSVSRSSGRYRSWRAHSCHLLRCAAYSNLLRLLIMIVPSLIEDGGTDRLNKHAGYNLYCNSVGLLS